MIDVFEIGASLNIHGNGMDFLQAFSSALMGNHRQLDELEKKLGSIKGAMKDLFVGGAEVFAGVEILRGLGELAESGKELNHQQSMLMRNGVSHRDVLRETSAIYKDMLRQVPTASAVDFLRTLGELKTVKGSIYGARETLVQSLKIEGLIGNATGKSAEGQGYDFWRAVEDKGIIQNKKQTDEFLNAMVQGTLATQGKIGGGDWFTYARRAGSAWMGDDLKALPLQLMEMQTLGASGAGVARRAFANRIEGAIKLTKTQAAGWNEIGMLLPGGKVKDSMLEQARPDLFMQETINALKAHGIVGEEMVKAWSARALHGKDADYFMTAYKGMSEVDPESGLTRVQKERKNIGEAQPLDLAYDTMMKTDFEANMHALGEQWKSFTEALGAPATKAAIPVLRDLTSAVTSMANFADKHQDITQAGIDVAAIGGSLLVLGGSLKVVRGAIRLATGGLLGIGRNALGFGIPAKTMMTAGETQLRAAQIMMEAAGGGGGPARDEKGRFVKREAQVFTETEKEVAKAAGPSALPFFAGGAMPGVVAGTILAGGAAGGYMKAPMADDYGRVIGNWGGDPDHPYGIDPEHLSPRPTVTFGTMWDWLVKHVEPGASAPEAERPPPVISTLRDNRLRSEVFGPTVPLPPIYAAPSPPLSYTAPNTDVNSIYKDEGSATVPSIWKRIFGAAAEPAEAAGKQFAEMKTQAGIVLTAFTDLDKGTVGTAGKFTDLLGASDVLGGAFGTLDNGTNALSLVFGMIEQTGIGAARALAEIALGSGFGAGGGGGVINASWGGGGGGGMSGGGWSGNALAVGGGFGGGSWAKSGATRPEVAAYIREVAGSLGIDPQVALRVSQSEGFNAYTGDYGTSFGPFQLHYGGSGIRGMNSDGLGDIFTRETGLNARDPSTWKAQVDFALRVAKREGWGAWHGAAHVGIGNRQGLDWRGSLPTVTAPPRKSTPGHPASDKPMVSAQNDTTHNHHIYLDGKKIAQVVTKHQAASGRFPTSRGETDAYTFHTPSNTPTKDVA